MPDTRHDVTPDQLAEAAIARLTAPEVDRLRDLIAVPPETIADHDPVPGSPAFRVVDFYLRRALARMARPGPTDTAAQMFLLRMETCLSLHRKSCAPDRRKAGKQRALAALGQTILGRRPRPGEIEALETRIAGGLTGAELLSEIGSGRGDWVRRSAAHAPDGISEVAFIRAVLDIIVGRPVTLYDILNWQRRMAKEGMSRHDMLMTVLRGELLRRNAAAEIPAQPLWITCPGLEQGVSAPAWDARTADAEGRARALSSLRQATPYDLAPATGSDSTPVVSVITSLWRGRDFIERFLDTMLSQSCMDGRAELIIIDAASPEGEAEIIARRTEGRSDVIYHRTETRIGIYAAWNIGARLARGRYLTNANLDDVRRADSLAIQAGALDAHPWVDVIYQDFLVTLDPTLDWAKAAAYGFVSNLPPVTARNMMRFNLPHHAPMWRRDIHRDVGFFDETLTSAGDVDFWLRCLAAGKRFFKVNEPHAVYYFNPDGISSRTESPGPAEAAMVRARMTDELLPAHLETDVETFARQHLGLGDIPTNDRLRLVQLALQDLGRANRPPTPPAEVA